MVVSYGLLLISQRRFEEASQEMKKAQELDPLSRMIGAALGLNYFYAGRHDQAIQQARAILEIDANFAPPATSSAWLTSRRACIARPSKSFKSI